MAISPVLIDDIRERADLVSIISEYVPLKKRGVNFVGLCPFHQEKTPSFSVNSQKNIWHCFGCGEGGNIYTFLMKVNNWPFVEAIENVAERVGVSLPQDRQEQSHREKYGFLYKQLDRELHGYIESLSSDKGISARNYLSGRKISNDMIHQFRLGYAVSGRFRERLIFPVFDVRDRCLAFGGRILDSNAKTAKYINSAESPIYTKGNHLYGLNIAKPAIQKQNRAIVVEGYMDVLACHQAGVHNVVGVLGTALTLNQSRLLKRFTENITLVFDADDAGRKATLRSLEILAPLAFQLSVAALPGKDPDDVIQHHGVVRFREALAAAVPRLKYQVDHWVSQFNTDTPEGKSQAVAACKKLLESEPRVLQEEYKKYLAKCLKIDYFTLSGLVRRPPDGQKRLSLKQGSPLKKETKIALGLLNHALNDVHIRREVFTHFIPADFLDVPLIALAEALEKSSDEGAAFVDQLTDPVLRSKATEIMFRDDQTDFPTYLSAFQEVKKQRLLTDIKKRIRRAGSQKDVNVSALNELQTEYLELTRDSKNIRR